MGLEILKDGNGWTDEETYNHFCYNLQVRYALGLNDLNEHYFDKRTIYNFRRRLVNHLRESGENLIERVFEKITQEQMKKYEVKGNVQRMDSIQITRNIRQSSRLQLLIEIVQRVERIFSTEDKTKYEELLSPYIKGDSSHYLYRLKGEKHQSHIEKIGEVMEQLVRELETNYGEENNYKLLVRVFHEHFKQVEGGVTTGVTVLSVNVPATLPNRLAYRVRLSPSNVSAEPASVLSGGEVEDGRIGTIPVAVTVLQNRSTLSTPIRPIEQFLLLLLIATLFAYRNRSRTNSENTDPQSDTILLDQ